MKLNSSKTALTLGLLVSGGHLGWSILVLLGLAQSLLDFICWAHMITNPYQVSGFTITQALTLVIVTFGVGYVVGWIFAWVWNMLHK